MPKEASGLAKIRRKDVIDRAIIEERKNEPKRPLRDYLAARKQQVPPKN